MRWDEYLFFSAPAVGTLEFLVRDPGVPALSQVQRLPWPTLLAMLDVNATTPVSTSSSSDESDDTLFLRIQLAKCKLALELLMGENVDVTISDNEAYQYALEHP
jgi:hypothetical protein